MMALCGMPPLMEFEVGSDCRARRDDAAVADGSAIRPYPSATAFPVAGSNEVSKRSISRVCLPRSGTLRLAATRSVKSG